MKLEGWTHSLPDWLEKAVMENVVTVHSAKGFQYLLGEVMNPEGTLIKFL